MKRLLLMFALVSLATPSNAKQKDTVTIQVVSSQASMQEFHRATRQVHIRVVMPDGSHVTLWCEAVLRRCVSLEPGSYDADLKGDAAWVYTHELSGTMRKTKYHAVGNWSVGPEPIAVQDPQN